MGLHIIPYILGEWEDDGQGGKYLKTEEFKGFDSVRHGGDREFARTQDFEWDTIVEDENDLWSRYYCRPKDLDKAVDWVDKQDLPIGNKMRLKGLLYDMRMIPRLYLYFSY
jgi:hypothetical protein